MIKTMGKLKIILAVFSSLLAIIGGISYRLTDVILPEAEDIKKNIQYDIVTGAINILLVGEDSNDGSHRADAIAVIRVNVDEKEKSVKVLSLPRDTRVEIPGKGWQKINHAYAYGEIDLLRRTVINYLGIPLNYYVMVDYAAFPKIVDLIGGVEIAVEKRLRYTDRAAGLVIDIPKGMQHMNGETALKYVRFRNDALGDIGRVKRQQRFILAVLSKIKSPSIVARYPKLVGESMKMVKTDLNLSQALQLASYIQQLSVTGDLQFATLPGYPSYINGISYWVGDLKAASIFLASASEKNISGDLAYSQDTIDTSDFDLMAERDLHKDMKSILKDIRTPIAVLNGDGTKGISAETAKKLREFGVDVAYVGNAKHFDYHASLVLYPPGKEAESLDAAEALRVICGIPKRLVREDSSITYVTLLLGHNYKTIQSKVEESFSQ